ncbi:MAG: hypothetical protein NZ530_06830 [Thermodesulfobacteriaceae bacterium]|nr:hypothetical protein [Thermodesulfobacteriaceae bacterium]
MRPYYIVFNYQNFKKYYLELREGDLIVLRIPFKKNEIGLIVDLIYRKVEAFPSFLSQILSSSKTLQAEILWEFMPPYTLVVRDKISLLSIFREFSHKFDKVITKEDRANCGMGVHLWNSLEEVFNFAGYPPLEFPFVLQPFYKISKDIRVIILGDYHIEAYQRINTYNFRQNLFLGGEAKSYKLSEEELDFCKRVIERGKFPHAHLDLIYIEGEGPYLSEINLKGGIKGAEITTEAYEKIIKKLTLDFIKEWEKKYSPIMYLGKPLKNSTV